MRRGIRCYSYALFSLCVCPFNISKSSHLSRASPRLPLCVSPSEVPSRVAPWSVPGAKWKSEPTNGAADVPASAVSERERPGRGGRFLRYVVRTVSASAGRETGLAVVAAASLRPRRRRCCYAPGGPWGPPFVTCKDDARSRYRRLVSFPHRAPSNRARRPVAQSLAFVRRVGACTRYRIRPTFLQAAALPALISSVQCGLG